MTTSTETTKQAGTSLTRDWIQFAVARLRPYLGTRRGLLILGVSALALGGILSWDWLVAVGLAPLLVAAAPCAIMCALGLCMGRMGGQSCSKQASVTDGQPDTGATPPDPSIQMERVRLVDLPDTRSAEPAVDPSEGGEKQAPANLQEPSAPRPDEGEAMALQTRQARERT